MTPEDARQRYPFVPADVVTWAVQNIDHPRDLERCLRRLEQSRRIQLRYAGPMQTLSNRS